MSSSLQFQTVLSFEGSLEDGGSEFGFLSFTFTSRDKDIQTEDLVKTKFEFFNLLVIVLLVVDDTVVTIDQVLLHFMRQNTFKGVTFIRGGDLFDNIGNVVIFISGSQDSKRGLEGIESGKDSISTLSFGTLGTVLTNDNSVGSLTNETINMGTTITKREIEI